MKSGWYFFSIAHNCGRDALRQENRDASADAEKLHVRNGAQPAQEIFELVIAEATAGSPPLSSTSRISGWRVDIFNLLVELRMKIVASGVADQRERVQYRQ